MFRQIWGYATRLRVYAEIKEPGKDILEKANDIANALADEHSPWVAALFRVRDCFLALPYGSNPDLDLSPYDVTAVALALESRILLDRILLASLDSDLLVTTVKSDLLLEPCGCTLWYLNDTTYKICTEKGKPPKHTWCVWRDKVDERLWDPPVAEA